MTWWPWRGPRTRRPRTGNPVPPTLALISYTSGTSGTPKGATNTHGNIMYNAERQGTGLGLPERPVYFAMAPLFHITGMVCQFGACLNSAGTLVLAYRFEAGVVLDAFAEHRPHYTVGPSTAFMALAAHPSVTRDHFASFRMISSGGAPLPPALVEKFRAGFGPYIRNGYGLTECTAPCASVPPGLEAPVDPASGTLAVGLPGPDTVVRIVDDAGRGGALRRAGRDRRPRPAGRPRLLAAPRRHRRDLPRRRTAHRRHRFHGRRRAGCTSSTARRT